MITRSKFLWIQNAALALIVLFVSFWVSNPLFNKGVTGKNTYHFTVENASEGKIYLKTALFMADRHHLALEGSGHLLASGELIEIGTTDNALPNGFEYEWLDIATGKYYVWEASLPWEEITQAVKGLGEDVAVAMRLLSSQQVALSVREQTGEDSNPWRSIGVYTPKEEDPQVLMRNHSKEDVLTFSRMRAHPEAFDGSLVWQIAPSELFHEVVDIRIRLYDLRSPNIHIFRDNGKFDFKRNAINRLPSYISLEYGGNKEQGFALDFEETLKALKAGKRQLYIEQDGDQLRGTFR
jgi:hypothetical protein